MLWKDAPAELTPRPYESLRAWQDRVKAYDLAHPDELTLINAESLNALEARISAGGGGSDLGIPEYVDGTPYDQGVKVLHGGSIWVATRATSGTPGIGNDWVDLLALPDYSGFARQPILPPVKPAPLTGFAYTVDAGQTPTWNAGSQYILVQAQLPGGEVTDYQDNVLTPTLGAGRVTLSVDPYPNAIGYRWYAYDAQANPATNPTYVKYWDTTAPTLVLDRTTGTPWDAISGIYYPWTAVPVCGAYRLNSLTVPALSGSAFYPMEGFTPQHSWPVSDPIATWDPATPEFVQLQRPGVYLVTVTANFPSGADPSGITLGTYYYGDGPGIDAGLTEDFHAGHEGYIANSVNGPGNPEMFSRKTYVTNGRPGTDRWKIGARLGNRKNTPVVASNLSFNIVALSGS